MIPTVQSIAWYHTWFVNDPGQMVDYNNKILGIIRIRQHRHERHTCPRDDLAKMLNMTCVPEFSYNRYLTEDFEEYWRPSMVQVEYSRTSVFWKFGKDGQTVTGK